MEALYIILSILAINAVSVGLVSLAFRYNSKIRKKQGKGPSDEIIPSLVVTSIFGPLCVVFLIFVGLVELWALIYRKCNFVKIKNFIINFAEAEDVVRERELDRWEVDLENKQLKKELLRLIKELAEYVLIYGDKP